MNKKIKFNLITQLVYFLLILIYISPSRLYIMGFLPLEFGDTYISDTIFNIFDFLIIFIFILITKKYFKQYSRTYVGLFVFCSIILFFIMISLFLESSSSFDIHYFLNSISKIIRFYFVYLVFYISHNKAKNTRVFLDIIMIIFIVLILIAPISLRFFDIYSVEIGRAGTLGLPPNYLGLIATTTIITGLLVYKRCIVKFLFITVGSYGILFSGSRRALAVSVILITLVVIANLFRSFIKIIKKPNLNYNAKKIFILILFSVPLFFITYSVFKTQIIFFQTRLSQTPLISRIQNHLINWEVFFTDSGRDDNISFGIQLLKDNLFGYGGSDAYLNSFYIPTGHIHNIFIQIGLMYGIITLFIFFSYIITRIIKSISVVIYIFFHKSVNIDHLGFVSLFLIIIIFDLFDYSLAATKTYYFFIISLAFTNSVLNKNKRRM